MVPAADTGYVMLFVVALFIWFALSIPATLLIARLLGSATADSRVPSPERRAPTHRRGLVRS